ncbi:MAG TPA: hypothetical protein VFA07_08520 [Chthonomonadaceae bacterium]|nr:hypothetical protein [Chthonomonadaceae bacterium]
MQKEVKPGLIALAVILLLAFIAFLGWRSFGSKGDTLPQASVQSHWQSKKSGPNR